MATDNTHQRCPKCGSDQTTVQVIDRSEQYSRDLSGGPGATRITIRSSISCNACEYYGELRDTGWRQGK